MDKYKQALMMGVRFNTTSGSIITLERMCSMKKEDLNEMGMLLQEELEKSGKRSLLKTVNKEDAITKLKYDLIVDMIETKLAQEEEIRSRKANKEYEQKVLAELERRKEGKLQTMSDADLLASIGKK